MSLEPLLAAYRALRLLRPTLAAGAHQAACDAARARVRALVELLYPQVSAALAGHTAAEIDALLDLPPVAFRAYVAHASGAVFNGEPGQ